MNYNDIVVLIPTLNPSQKLIKLTNILKENGYNHIIVVDDGSTDKTIIKK